MGYSCVDEVVHQFQQKYVSYLGLVSASPDDVIAELL